MTEVTSEGLRERAVTIDDVRAGNVRLVSTEEKRCGCGGAGGKVGKCPGCQSKDYSDFNHGGGKGHPEYLRLLDALRALHLRKSGGYGTGQDPFANFTAVAQARNQPRFVYAVDRAQEKLTRVYSLLAQGRLDELGEEFEDLASLFLCAEAMRRSDAA